MVNYTQTNCRLLQTNSLSMFDDFVGLALKGLNVYFGSSIETVTLKPMEYLGYKHILSHNKYKSKMLINIRYIYKILVPVSERYFKYLLRFRAMVLKMSSDFIKNVHPHKHFSMIFTTETSEVFC